MRGLQKALAAVVGGAACLLTGCIEFDVGGISDRYREDFHFSYPLSSGGTINLESFNGSIDITGWDKDIVEIDGTKSASNEARMKEIKIDISPDPNSITIRAVRPVDRFGNAGAKFVLHVPKHVTLSNISGSNGTMRIENIQGRAHLKTSNGTIHASRIEGQLDAETSNGSVEISEVTGDTTVRTSNGAVHAELRKGGFFAHTSNGSVTARLLEADDHPVRLETSNGHIDLTMDTAREVRATTSNSSITVHMPSSINARLDAHTSNASITSDFDVSVHGGTISKHHMEGAIGSGGPLLDLSTSNGGIKLLRF